MTLDPGICGNISTVSGDEGLSLFSEDISEEENLTHSDWLLAMNCY